MLPPDVFTCQVETSQKPTVTSKNSENAMNTLPYGNHAYSSKGLTSVSITTWPPRYKHFQLAFSYILGIPNLCTAGSPLFKPCKGVRAKTVWSHCWARWTFNVEVQYLTLELQTANNFRVFLFAKYTCESYSLLIFGVIGKPGTRTYTLGTQERLAEL